jgi:hypothetical protein
MHKEVSQNAPSRDKSFSSTFKIVVEALLLSSYRERKLPSFFELLSLV